MGWIVVLYLQQLSRSGESVTRVFLTLAIISTILLAFVFFLGLNIGDAKIAEPEIQSAVSKHFLMAIGGLVLGMLVHALVLTYFMGTGRWLEETSKAYQLPDSYRAEGQGLKYRTLPLMVGAIFMLVMTGGFGGAADPASPVGFQGWFGISPATLHLIVASLALAINAAANLQEFRALERNGEIIKQIVEEVRRIRNEHGLTD